jgi:hypothetical protein
MNTNLTNSSALVSASIFKLMQNSSQPLILGLRCVALLTNLINLGVLIDSRLSNSTYKYLRATALADILYCLCIITIPMIILVCGMRSGQPNAMCGRSAYHSFFIVFIILDEFLSSALALFSILADIFITIQRIYLMSNSESFVMSLRARTVCFVLLMVSLSAYAPTLFMYEVSQSQSIVKLVRSKFGQSNLGLSILSALGLARVLLSSVVLLVLNLFTVFKLKAHLREKMRLVENTSTRSNINRVKSERRVTIMLVFTSFSYVLGNLPHFVLYVCKKLFNIHTSQLLGLHRVSQYSIVSFLMLKLAIYSCFNRPFRRVLISNFRYLIRNEPRSSRVSTHH